MRGFLALIGLLVINTLSGQDSINKTKLSLFDINFNFGLLYHNVEPSMDEVSRYTTHHEYLTADFIRRYSKFERNHAHRHSLGTSGGEINFNATFYLKHKNNFIKRIKPRLGYTSSSFVYFEFESQYELRLPVDSIYYENPLYPPVIVDSVSYGSLIYKFRGQRSLVNFGANFDLLRHPRYICHIGLLLSMGKSTNTFMVSKNEYFSFSAQNNHAINYKKGGILNEINVEMNEASAFISRLMIPVGWQHRFLPRRKFSHGIFFEMRPGFELLKIKNKPVISNSFMVLSGGVKFNFRYNK